MEGASRTFQHVKEMVGAAHRGTSAEEKLQFYEQWAKDYDSDVSMLEYRAPTLSVETLAPHVPAGERGRSSVLDVACGTGLVAQQLQTLGFRQIHGIDGCSKMLEVARMKGVYTSMQCCVLGDNPLPLESGGAAGQPGSTLETGRSNRQQQQKHRAVLSTGVFDVVMLCGALSVGHISHAIFPELIRVAKPGALLCLTTRTDAGNASFVRGMEGRMQELSGAGAWELVRREEVVRWERAVADGVAGPAEDAGGPPYIPGVVYIYRKLAA